MIFIKDIGSLHGTFLNGSQLGRTQAQQLHVGDIIKFGISIERANDKFPQCVMEVEFFFGKPKYVWRLFEC
jgi:pSer/pThr/pTyr-binding forkhead associated (FHA) protein